MARQILHFIQASLIGSKRVKHEKNLFLTFFFLKVLTSILAGFWLVKIRLRSSSSSSSKLATHTPSLNWARGMIMMRRLRQIVHLKRRWQ